MKNLIRSSHFSGLLYGGMHIASAMVRPHVVNFMDQMLRAGDHLIRAGVALVLMTSPTGRARIEKQLGI